MYYVISIALILGGGLFAWKPKLWLDLTQCRSGCCNCGECSEWAVSKTRASAVLSALLGVACLIQLLCNL